VPRAGLFDLDPGVIGAVLTLPLGEFISLDNHVNQNASPGKNWSKGYYPWAGHEFQARQEFSLTPL
jgi:hypothetical protein